MLLTSPSNQMSIPVLDFRQRNQLSEFCSHVLHVDYEYEYTNECQCNGLDKVRISHNFTLALSGWHSAVLKPCQIRHYEDT